MGTCATQTRCARSCSSMATAFCSSTVDKARRSSVMERHEAALQVVVTVSSDVPSWADVRCACKCKRSKASPSHCSKSCSGCTLARLQSNVPGVGLSAVDQRQQQKIRHLGHTAAARLREPLCERFAALFEQSVQFAQGS